MLLTIAPAGGWEQKPPELAALVGERLEFRVRWGVIPAADATLEVADGGEGRVLLRATASTLPLVDLLYPVRDLVESTVRLEGPSVERYYKRAREGRRAARQEEIVFDLQAGVARYRRDERPSQLLEVPPDVQDPLSCFYSYRTRWSEADEEVQLPISDGKRLIIGRVRTIGREIVTTPAGSFRTVIIEPDIEGLGGIFRKSPGARILIWLTDDAWRRPVKLQSQVTVGNFTAELTGVTHTLPHETLAASDR